MKRPAETIDRYDIAVAGAGMAGLTAAVAGASGGRDVVVFEKAPEGDRGGNTRFTNAMRVPTSDLNVAENQEGVHVPDCAYTTEDMFEDVVHASEGDVDRDRVRTLVERTPDTVRWLTELGLEWEPADRIVERPRLWVTGEDVVDSLVEAATSGGCDLWYDAPVTELNQAGDSSVSSVTVDRDDRLVEVTCEATVLATGDFGGNSAKLSAHLGTDYDRIVYRGSEYNTGDGLDLAFDVGARPAGAWSRAHVSLVDADTARVEASETRFDDYPYGIMVDAEGRRFVDEGQDTWPHTYAQFGRIVYEQPAHRAYVVFDAATHDLVDPNDTSKAIVADSVETLATRLDMDDPSVLRQTVAEFNHACQPGEFDPSRTDGLATDGITPPKSNWARPLTEAPFHAYPVTGGVTFTYGGIRTTTEAEVLDTTGDRIPGLFAAGTCTGGLFSEEYPGATALTAAAVFGKTAGEQAARYADAR